MSGPQSSKDAQWRLFLSSDEAEVVNALDEQITFHEGILNELRKERRKYANRHAWRTRKNNPWQGGRVETSGD